MNNLFFKGGPAVIVVFLCLGFFASGAVAGEVVEYKRNPQFSLTGDCTTSGVDTIPDPSCPYSPPPNGPSGRFNEPRSIAIDAYGNEYVASYANGQPASARIDVFDDEGNFITELTNPSEPNFGPKSLAVDSLGNLYVWEHASAAVSEIVKYEPTIYEGEAGNIEYDPSSRTVITEDADNSNGGLAIDISSDRLFVAGLSTIEVFKSAAEGNAHVETITGPHINWTNWVAIDSQRDRLYASFCKNGVIECGIVVMELEAPHTVLEEIEGPGTAANPKFLSNKGWLSIAVNEENGHFFVDDLEQSKNIYEFHEDFTYAQTITESSFSGGNALQIAFSNSPKDPSAKNHGFLYVPLQKSSGNALAFSPVEEFAPVVSEAAVDNVGEAEAELSAVIDPEGALTEYFLEYEVAGSGNPQVAEAGTLGANAQPTEVTDFATGLAPGVEYRFRAFAKNALAEDEEEVFFTTYADAPISNACANQAFRIGPSALLPDCRAYELVTPPDTNGFPPKGIGYSGDRFATLQASPAGNALSFRVIGGILSGFEGTGSFDGDPYLTTRSASGWNTTAAGPNGTETNAVHPGGTSPDQGHTFWGAGEKGTAVVEPGENNYVRFPDGHSELIGTGSEGIDPRAKGMLITENGTHIVFQTVNGTGSPARPLEPNAPPAGTTAVYDRVLNPATGQRETHVVSLLPGDVTPGPDQDATYVGASPDGEGIAFAIGSRLYLRLHNEETRLIDEGVEFAGVSEGGGRVFYVKAGNLIAYDTASGGTITFADTAAAVTPVNVATGGTRAYFVSTSAITGSGPNPEGDSPQGGQQNLYLSEEGQISFVATVTVRDVVGDENNGEAFDGLGLWTDVLGSRDPARDPSRLTPSGDVMLFQSRANITGYDSGNTPQVYRYDDAAGSLECISCLPTGLPPSGEGGALQSYTFNTSSSNRPFGTSAFVPNVTPDGRRVFFESTEALVSRDTDGGVRDVYEWEANGVGSCTKPQGCVYLISSGRSEHDNFLYGHSTSGDDVFFTTRDVLLPSDTGGTLSIYDARVGGGFPEPEPDICAGEGCKPVLTMPPPLTSPGQPAGVNDNVKTKRKICPKGKRKVKRAGKVRCVKKKKHRKRQHRKSSAQNRGASR